MKYFFIIFILLIASCIESKDKKILVNDRDETQYKLENSSTETSTTNSIVHVVDYEGLAPLLAKRNDTTYIVNFWATWCKPCIKEIPAFETLQKEYATKKVSVILVSLDFPDKIEQQVVPFIKKNALKSKVLLLDDPDANMWIPAIDEGWSGAIPATIIFNKKHRKFYERSFTYSELKKEILSIL